MYLDLDGNNAVQRHSNGKKSQIWWFDQKTLTIKSEMYRGKSLNIQGNGRSKQLEVHPTNGAWWQQFKWDDKAKQLIQRRSNQVVQVQGGSDTQNRNVDLGQDEGKAHQKWTILYTDKVKTRTKGRNEIFGFDIGRKFVIQSRFFMQRVVEAPRGARHQNLKLTQLAANGGREWQHWEFDEVSKTLYQPGNWKDCMTITGNGGSRDVRMSPRTSRWW